jgi:hypothetical protein
MDDMRRLCAILLFIVGSGLLCRNLADAYVPGPEIIVNLEKLNSVDPRIPASLGVREVKSKMWLPASIWSQVNADNMAEPGGAFDSGCIRREGVPSQRLIFGGMTSDYFIVHFERGGYAHGFTTELYHREGANWQLLWHTYALEVKSLSQLTEKIQSFELCEDNCPCK